LRLGQATLSPDPPNLWTYIEFSAFFVGGHGVLAVRSRYLFRLISQKLQTYKINCATYDIATRHFFRRNRESALLKPRWRRAKDAPEPRSKGKFTW
jgi:hypothetical protein